MKRTKTLKMAVSIYAALSAGPLFAATLQIEKSSVVVMAGQTIEIPLSSDRPISGDLTAKGAFESGDIIFTDGPGCRVSANGCTLIISAARSSRIYTNIPVTVTADAANLSSVFSLSVIRPKQSVHVDIQVPEMVSAPIRLFNTNSTKNILPAIEPIVESPSVVTRSEKSIQRSGNKLFYAEAITPSGQFAADINGPSYKIVALKNNGASQSLRVLLTGSGASYFTIDKRESIYGVNRNCATMNRIGSGESCFVIIKGEIGDPRKGPETATLTLQGDGRSPPIFQLSDTTYIYAAGGFNTLGNASVSGGSLLAACTAGTCVNALQGTSGNNYASTNFSVGQWINALAVTPAGNVMVGGVFGEIGGATSGASSGTVALLAQCTLGPVIGNACINQINTGATANPYAFNNGYINGITSPFAIGVNNFMIVAGDFTNIRNFSVTSGGRMLAKCQYSGTSSSSTCNNFLNNSTKFADNAIVAVDTLGSSSGSSLVNVGGLFTQIAGYPSSAPSSGTTFANCTTSTCSQGMGSNNPNGSILGITNDGTSLYLGGSFTQIGGYIDSGGGYPLVSCTPGATTTCSNALSGSNNANGRIEGIAYSGGNLYVGGKFTTIGGATPVSSGYMLAVCTVGGSCSNFITDTNPYATGSDWGGVISAVAIGTQTIILGQ